MIRFPYGIADFRRIRRQGLILRRDTHIDSLTNRLREARVRWVIEPILAGELPEKGVPEDDVAFVEDLGLVALGPSGYGMANPIYREVVPRALTSLTERAAPAAPPNRSRGRRRGPPPATRQHARSLRALDPPENRQRQPPG